MPGTSAILASSRTWGQVVALPSLSSQMGRKRPRSSLLEGVAAVVAAVIVALLAWALLESGRYDYNVKLLCRKDKSMRSGRMNKRRSNMDFVDKTLHHRLAVAARRACESVGYVG